jgi:hypothetical protein
VSTLKRAVGNYREQCLAIGIWSSTTTATQREADRESEQSLICVRLRFYGDVPHAGVAVKTASLAPNTNTELTVAMLLGNRGTA